MIFESQGLSNESLSDSNAFSGESRELFSTLYQKLHSIARRLMAGESPGQTLQATALLNEAFLKISGRAEVAYNDQLHFVYLASRVMQRILVDRARAKRRLKRGGNASRLPLCESLMVTPNGNTDLIDLDDALTDFEMLDPKRAKLVRLHIFAGLTLAECAKAMGISKSTAERSWRFSRAWLLKRMEGNREGAEGST